VTDRPKHREETWEYVWERFILLPLWGFIFTSVAAIIAAFIVLLQSIL
jgi:hypothetical protein